MARLLLLSMLLPSLALAQGVARARPQSISLWAYTRNATLTTGAPVGGRKMFAHEGAFQITGLSFTVTTNAPTATGTMVFALTDGTTTCTSAAVDCTTSDVRANGAKGISFSGCLFPAGASITGSVQTACTTAQPTISNVVAVGFWR